MSVKAEKLNITSKDERTRPVSTIYKKLSETSKTVLFNECRSCKLFNNKTLSCEYEEQYDDIDLDEAYEDFISGLLDRKEYETITRMNIDEDKPLSYVEIESSCYAWTPISKCDEDAYFLDYDNGRCVYAVCEDDTILDLKKFSEKDDALGWLVVKKISL